MVVKKREKLAEEIMVLCTLAHICNSSTYKPKARGNHKFEAILDYIESLRPT